MARRTYRTRNVYWGAFILGWFEHLQDHDLSAADYRILFYLCDKMMADDNTARKRQKTIAEDLRMDKGNVSRCIKKLCAKQFIAKVPDGYMINPHLFYVGSNPQHRQNLRATFDDLLESPRFYLDEDEYKLTILKDDDDERFYW